MTGFRAQNPTPASRVVGFLLQNPSHSTRPTLYTNPIIFGEIQARFGEIRRHPSEILWDPATFEEIQARFSEIRRHSRRSKRDLVRSGDIRGDPSEILTIFGEIRQDSRRSRLISAIFGADLLGFCRFQRIFWRYQRRFGVFLLRSREFCKNQVTIWCFFA